MIKSWRYLLLPIPLIFVIVYRQALFPFLIAIIAAYLLDMPARWFERKLGLIGSLSLRRGAAAALSILCTLLLLLLFTVLLVPRIIDSAIALYAKLPGYWAALLVFVESLPLLSSIQLPSAEELPSILEFTDLGTIFLGKAWTAVRNLGGIVVTSVSGVITAVICALYILFCKHSILRQFATLFRVVLPERLYKKCGQLLSIIHEVFSKYIAGRFWESTVLAVLCFIGLALSGIPYAPLLAFIVGFSNLIPVLGTLIAVIPCILLLVVIDPIKALWFLVFVIALQQLDNNLLYPKIVGTSVGLPVFWSVVCVLLGARIGGAGGAFLAVPCAAVCYRLLSTYVRGAS